jgi:hypothetical protein
MSFQTEPNDFDGIKILFLNTVEMHFIFVTFYKPRLNMQKRFFQSSNVPKINF